MVFKLCYDLSGENYFVSRPSDDTWDEQQRKTKWDSNREFY